jgi:hypothetical protein
MGQLGRQCGQAVDFPVRVVRREFVGLENSELLRFIEDFLQAFFAERTARGYGRNRGPLGSAGLDVGAQLGKAWQGFRI